MFTSIIKTFLITCFIMLLGTNTDSQKDRDNVVIDMQQSSMG
ncbi:hypothetical protein [Colwellia sp. M166]|nr:hypothetical protein [Colwellia sp. M166]